MIDQIVSVLIISFIISACKASNPLDHDAPQEPTLSPTSPSPSQTLTSSPEPTNAQIATLSVDALMQDLDNNEWSVFPESADLLICRTTYITQTIEGTMWFGCGLGLTNFDGSNWNSYTLKELYDISSITAVSPAPDGSLWIGTKSNGLLKYDGEEWVQIPATDGSVGSEITTLSITTDGVIWIGTKHGLSKFESNQWTSYYPEQIRDYDYVRSMAVTSDGTVWCGSDSGILLYFDGTDWRRHTKIYGEFGQPIVDMAATDDNGLWLIRGPDIVHIGGGKTERYQSDAFYYSPPTSIAIAKNGTVWVGTYGGYKAAYFEEETWKTINEKDIIEFISSHDHSLPFSGVFTIYVDSTGDIWFGTVNGAYRYKN